VEDDALAADVDEGVGRPEVDREVSRHGLAPDGHPRRGLRSRVGERAPIWRAKPSTPESTERGERERTHRTAIPMAATTTAATRKSRLVTVRGLRQCSV